jgi:hypothetical protein
MRPCGRCMRMRAMSAAATSLCSQHKKRNAPATSTDSAVGLMASSCASNDPGTAPPADCVGATSGFLLRVTGEAGREGVCFGGWGAAAGASGAEQQRSTQHERRRSAAALRCAAYSPCRAARSVATHRYDMSTAARASATCCSVLGSRRAVSTFFNESSVWSLSGSIVRAKLRDGHGSVTCKARGLQGGRWLSAIPPRAPDQGPLWCLLLLKPLRRSFVCWWRSTGSSCLV